MAMPDNAYDVNPQETQEENPIEEVETNEEELETDADIENNEEQIEEKEPSVDMSDEELTDLGIDDPKQWKSYQRQFTKAQMKLKEIEAENSRLRQEVEQSQKKVEPIKVPETPPLVKPVMPKLPKKPDNFSWEDVNIPGTVSNHYMQEKEKYDADLYDYNIKKDEYDFKFQQQVDNERQIRAKQQENERIKIESINRIMATGMTLAEANDCWNEAINPQFYSPENIALLYKIKKGYKPNPKNDNKGQRFDNHKKKREQFGIPPGVGGGNTQPIQDGDYTKNTDRSSWYNTK